MKTPASLSLGKFILLALLASTGLSQAANPSVIHVLLVGGQSNADGRADPAELPTSPVNFQAPQDDIPYYYTNPLTTLRPRATQFGPEITFGRAMADFYAPFSEKVAIVKYAAGGTNLYSQWKAGGDATTTGDGPQYVSFQTTIRAGLVAVQAAYPDATLVIEGMIWVQGESDIDGGTGPVAAYAENLTQFIADVRTTFLPNMPFFLSRISANQTNYSAPTSGSYSRYLTMRSQQQSVAANVPGAYLIDTDGANFTVRTGDVIHFGSGGQQALGNAFATALKSVVPAPVPRVLNLTPAPGTGQVALTWDAFPSADTYTVKRSTVSGGPYSTIASGLTAATYLDTGLTGGQPYFYVVSATTAGVETENSWPATAVPRSVTNALATTLTWDPLQNKIGSDGSGTWDNIATNFATANTDVAYTPSPATGINVAPFDINATTINVISSSNLLPGLAISLNQFPTGTTISSISGNVVTMSAGATTALAATTAATFAPIHGVVFGKANAAAGIVTVSGNKAANTLTLNPAASGNYTFTGGSITLGTNANINGQLNVNSSATFNGTLNAETISFASASKQIVLGGGGNAINTLNGATTNALTGTVIVNSGVYSNSGFNIQIGNPGTTPESPGTAGLVINGGTVVSNNTLNIGNGGNGNGLVTVNTGGTLNAATSGVTVGRGANNNGKLIIAGGSFNSPVGLLVGFFGASTGVLNLSSGTISLTGTTNAGDLAISSQSATTATTATVLISGGTLTTGDAGAVNFGNGGGNFTASNAGTGTLKLTGGSLYIGSGGMLQGGGGTFTSAISLTGGTIGAKAAWSSSLPMTLETTNGNVTFKAANAADAPFNIALSGVLSGNGGLTKSGTGTLTLSGANTYSGTTQIATGSLILGTTGSLASSALIDVKTGATLNTTALAAPFPLAVGKTLTGAGTVTGPISVAGTLAPGNGIGTLTTAATQLTGTLAVEIDGTSADKLVSTGAINLNGASLTVSLLAGGFTQPSYVIAQGTSLTGTFANVPAGYAVQYSATQAILIKSNFTTWASANGIAGEPASGDFDKDGISNLIEYALGLNPTLASPAPGTFANGLLSFAKGVQAVTNGDLIYAIEESTTLGDATDPWTVVTPTANDAGGISFQLPAGLPKEFARLRITQIP